MITPARAAEYDEVLAAVARWARQQPDIKAVAVVGSWARGEARMTSDVDLVILTDQKMRYRQDDAWVPAALARQAELVRSQEWGELTERRVRLSSGTEVEFDFVPPEWAATDPVDPGTARVVRAGCRPILDDHALLRDLIAAT